MVGTVVSGKSKRAPATRDGQRCVMRVVTCRVTRKLGTHKAKQVSHASVSAQLQLWRFIHGLCKILRWLHVRKVESICDRSLANITLAPSLHPYFFNTYFLSHTLYVCAPDLSFASVALLVPSCLGVWVEEIYYGHVLSGVGLCLSRLASVRLA